jgi:hypothetical protein
MKNLDDVKMFIDTLVATDMLWHADDLVEQIPNFKRLSNPKLLQTMMDDALCICADHDVSIFDFYPDE